MSLKWPLSFLPTLLFRCLALGPGSALHRGLSVLEVRFSKLYYWEIKLQKLTHIGKQSFCLGRELTEQELIKNRLFLEAETYLLCGVGHA